jgi:hypothetical protein
LLGLPALEGAIPGWDFLSVDATLELVRGIARPRQLRQFLVQEMGAKVDALDKLGRTPLFGATGWEIC